MRFGLHIPRNIDHAPVRFVACDVLRSDPALKIACGRLPVSGTDLMSQPTLSRLENAMMS
jgi:hypothetical protein